MSVSRRNSIIERHDFMIIFDDVYRMRSVPCERKCFSMENILLNHLKKNTIGSRKSAFWKNPSWGRFTPEDGT